MTEHVPALSARSTVLSLLLGAHPPRLTARDLVALGGHFGIAEGTVRVALSRMSSTGDLVVADGTYTLTERHLQRQEVNESRMRPRSRPYVGAWRMLVADTDTSTVGGGELAAQLSSARFAPLREGVWTRPDNLVAPLPDVGPGLHAFTALPADDRRLCRALWDLDGWAVRARVLLSALGEEGAPRDRLAAAAAAVRHLGTDPALPAELAPERWPADELRWAYDDYRTDLDDVLRTTPRPVAVPAPREKP